MVSEALTDVMKRADALTPDERLQLIAHLANQMVSTFDHARPRRSLREFQGIAPYPLAGEDAQQWVTRTRREGDEARERGLNIHR